MYPYLVSLLQLLIHSMIGSGKSTLMKFLEDCTHTHATLQQWANTQQLVRASFYFWNAGTEMQKSLRGLLQSLLYTILNGCPDLIPNICSNRWQCKQDSLSASEPWSVSELRQSFLKLKNIEQGMSRKFYLHVDGLDEYHGDHLEVIEILKSISTSPNVKLCVSSRPWNCFELALGGS
jgi:hypothetical protein